MEAVGFFLLGLTAWLLALFGPPLLALWCWRTATERSKAWLAHLLFLPCILAIEWGAVLAIFFAAHDDGKGPPGLGLLLIVPFAMLFGSVAIYYVALGWQVLKSMVRQTRGG